MSKILLKGLKQKEIMVKKICIDYKKIKYLEGNSLMICEDEDAYISSKKDVNYYFDLKRKIELMLIHIEQELSQFIYNEYLSKKNEGWWIYKYSRSTYYRIKHKAIDVFLEWWYV